MQRSQKHCKMTILNLKRQQIDEHPNLSDETLFTGLKLLTNLN